MNRNTRNTRNSQVKPFVSGGVISNFTSGITGIPSSPAGGNPNQNVIPIKVEDAVPNPIPVVTNMETNLQCVPKPEPNITPPMVPPVSVDTVIGDSNGANRKRWSRQPINKKIKRLRRNRRLRKLLTPKNAIMSLNELMGNNLSDYNIVPEEHGFVAQMYVNNIQYEGRGQSKMAAKNDASEKALRDIIIQKMMLTPKAIAKSSSSSIITTDDSEKMDTSAGDEEDDSAEVPMLHLASFALHKLFSEWQSEGYEIPDFKITAPIIQGEITPEKVVPVNVPAPKTQVPENAQSLHPSTLLCMMRPAAKYVDINSEGKTPNIIHRVKVEVDNIEFFGEARSKKQARKFAAIDACNQLFGTNFVKEDIN